MKQSRREFLKSALVALAASILPEKEFQELEAEFLKYEPDEGYAQGFAVVDFAEIEPILESEKWEAAGEAMVECFVEGLESESVIDRILLDDKPYIPNAVAVWVKKDGADDSSGLSTEKAKRTVRGALEVLRPGDILIASSHCDDFDLVNRPFLGWSELKDQFDET